MSRAVARDHMIEFCEPCSDARPEHQALHIRAKVVSQFIIYRAPKFPNLGIAVDSLDHLLGTERDQYADHNDSNFTGELTPAMQRLRQMKVHAARPQRNRGSNVRNGLKADG